jgi:hypothetical protein
MTDVEWSAGISLFYGQSGFLDSESCEMVGLYCVSNTSSRLHRHPASRVPDFVQIQAQTHYARYDVSLSGSSTCSSPVLIDLANSQDPLVDPHHLHAALQERGWLHGNPISCWFLRGSFFVSLRQAYRTRVE